MIKNLMQRSVSKKIISIFLILLSISQFFYITLFFLGNVNAQQSLLYQPESSITYNVNYTIYYESQMTRATSFKIWVARLENWSSLTTEDSFYSQNSEILNQNNPNNVAEHIFDEYDIYNNSYDYFEKQMEGYSGDQTFLLNYEYEITLNSHKWEIPDNLTIDDYDKDSELYQFYTSYQPYCEVNDTNIIQAAQSITEGKYTINEMVEAIFFYVIENLQYKIGDDPIGAAAALSTLSGDCSEFSSLMVALLRTVGIPARKVLGLAFLEEDSSAKYKVNEGDTWSYSTDDSNLPGHAWLQYYVPNIGWVAADPTWGHGLLQNGESYALMYLNQMDYLHLVVSIGDYYGMGIDPPLDLLDSEEEGIPEFPFIYPIGNAIQYEMSFSVDIEVINVDINNSNTSLFSLLIGSGSFLMILFGSGSFLILFLVGILWVRKKTTKKRYYK